MSDNSTQQGNDTVATDDIGGVKFQRVKVTFGADGSATDASSAAPLPVVATGVPGAGQTLVYGVINTASSGDNTLVAAQGSGQKIYVVSYAIVITSALTVQWKSGSNNKSGAMALAANGGIALAGSTDAPVLATNSNEALILNLSAATQVSGHYCYFVTT